MSFLNNLLSCLESYSERNALCIEGKFYTYEQLHKKAVSISQRIESEAVGHDIIGIITNNDLATYASILATWFTGKGFVPLNPRFPESRNRLIAKEASLCTILNSQPTGKSGNSFTDSSFRLICTGSLSEAGESDISIRFSQNKLAYLLFTSGSTGIPKGVPITFQNLNSFFTSFPCTGIRIEKEDRCLQMFDLTFDVSIAAFLLPLMAGACSYPVPGRGIKYLQIMKLLQERNLTVAILVPSFLSLMKPYFPQIQLPELHTCIFTAEASYQEMLLDWQPCIPSASIFNLYGPTEATIWCFTYTWKNGPGNSSIAYNGLIPIGQPFEGITAILLDENEKLITGKEQKGELCIHGHQITANYWNYSNSEAFITLKDEHGVKRFYKTGDICFLNENGDYMYCGRKDTQVQIQGFRVELPEIENKVREFINGPGVVALSCQDKIGTMEIHLFITGFKGTKADILSHLRSSLPHYMIPAGITIMDAFPLNRSEKVDRIKLLSMIDSEDKTYTGS